MLLYYRNIILLHFKKFYTNKLILLYFTRVLLYVSESSIKTFSSFFLNKMVTRLKNNYLKIENNLKNIQNLSTTMTKFSNVFLTIIFS